MEVVVPNLSPPIRTLSFDIGGVFFLGKADQAFFEHWAKQANLDTVRLRQLLWYEPDIEQANIGQLSADVYFERTAVRLGTDSQTIRTIVHDAFVGELNDDLIRYVRRLKKHVRVTALTNNWSFAQELITQYGMDDLFEVFISSADVGVKKPDPSIYQIMLDRLNVTPSEVVFVDDTLENIEVAQAHGIPCIHFVSTSQMIAELDQLLFNGSLSFT